MASESLKSSLKPKVTHLKASPTASFLLPLYCEYGTDMFKMLDAEFALIIYDKEKDEFIAARDPFGIRPLFLRICDRRCDYVCKRG